MSTQLTRTFNGKPFYCEFITVDKHQAKRKQEGFKKAGFRARIVELQDSGKKVYGVFVGI